MGSWAWLRSDEFAPEKKECAVVTSDDAHYTYIISSTAQREMRMASLRNQLVDQTGSDITSMA